MRRSLPFRPGSVGWLLAHEVRLLLFAMNGSRGQRGWRWSKVLVLLLAWLLMHVLAWVLWPSVLALAAAPPVLLQLLLVAALLLMSTLMFSMALNRSVDVLFERADLDLLLSSPLSASVIFRVRLGVLVLAVTAAFGFFLTPLAHIALLHGLPRYLLIYPLLLSCASLLVCAAMLLCLTLVARLGPQRTRVIAHVLAALSGAALFLLTQLFAYREQSVSDFLLTQCLPYLQQHRDAPVWQLLTWPLRALTQWRSALLLLALSAAVFLWMTHSLQHLYGRASEHSGRRRISTPRRALPPMRSGVTQAILRKEWRLLLRDWHLLARIGLQSLYLLPLLLLFFRASQPMPAAVAALTVLLAGLTGSLAWVIFSAEAAPQLLQLAPLSARQIRHAKMLAAALPSLCLLGLAAGWLGLSAPTAAGWLLSGGLLAQVGVLLIHVYLAKPAARSQFQRRGKGNLAATVCETLNNFSWAGALLALQHAALVWAGLGLAGGLAAVLLAYILRNKENNQE